MIKTVILKTDEKDNKRKQAAKMTQNKNNKTVSKTYKVKAIQLTNTLI